MSKQIWIVGIMISLMAFSLGCSAFMKADILMIQDDYRGAIELYQQYLVHHPDDFDAIRNLGFAYFKAGMSDRAVEAFRASLEITPSDPFTILYLGATYLGQKKLSQATEVWEQFEDSGRPQVENEIERQLVLLRAASRAIGSTSDAKASLVGQMEQATLQVEAAWQKAEVEAATEGGGNRNADGDGDGGGGSGGG